MTAAVILFWGVAWSLLGGILFLITKIFSRRLPHASLRHLAWTVAFSCVALAPISQIARWSLSASQENVLCAPPLSPDSRTNWFAVFLLGIWMAGTAFTLARACVAWRTIALWRRASLPYQMMPSIPSCLKVDVRIAHGELPAVPITWGFRKPVVLLPKSARQWEPSRAAAVLWHEFGHIRRFDNLTQLVALLACAFHWFNPVFWFAAKESEAESEIAADDFAIFRGVKPSAYASDLLAIASGLRGQADWEFPSVQTAMAKTFTLEHRLRSIVSPNSRRGPLTLWSYLKVAGSFTALGVTLMLATAGIVTQVNAGHQKSKPSCLATLNQTPKL